MNRPWIDGVGAALVMFLVYIVVDVAAIRLGWLSRIGWVGAFVASFVLGWLSYRRSARASVPGARAA